MVLCLVEVCRSLHHQIEAICPLPSLLASESSRGRTCWSVTAPRSRCRGDSAVTVKCWCACRLLYCEESGLCTWLYSILSVWATFLVLCGLLHCISQTSLDHQTVLIYISRGVTVPMQYRYWSLILAWGIHQQYVLSVFKYYVKQWVLISYLIALVCGVRKTF